MASAPPAGYRPGESITPFVPGGSSNVPIFDATALGTTSQSSITAPFKTYTTNRIGISNTEKYEVQGMPLLAMKAVDGAEPRNETAGLALPFLNHHLAKIYDVQRRAGVVETSSKRDEKGWADGFIKREEEVKHMLVEALKAYGDCPTDIEWLQIHKELQYDPDNEVLAAIAPLFNRTKRLSLKVLTTEVLARHLTTTHVWDMWTFAGFIEESVIAGKPVDAYGKMQAGRLQGGLTVAVATGRMPFGRYVWPEYYQETSRIDLVCTRVLDPMYHVGGRIQVRMEAVPFDETVRREYVDCAGRTCHALSYKIGDLANSIQHNKSKIPQQRMKGLPTPDDHKKAMGYEPARPATVAGLWRGFQHCSIGVCLMSKRFPKS